MPGTMSIGGLTSGMQTDSIISKYMDLARIPQRRLQERKDKATQKLTAWQDLNTRVLALQAKSESIAGSSAFQTKKVTSSLKDVVDVTASSDAIAGTYYISVEKSAKSHQISSQQYSGLDSSVSAGEIKITVDGSLTTVNIDPSNNTLTGVKDAINKANAGVRASVINKGTASAPDYRLLITSNNTGTDHQMVIDSGTTGLNINVGLESGNDATVVQAADDATIKMGNITFTRSSNSITDIIPGVTLDIANPDATKTVKIDVTQDNSVAKTAIKGFVDQYNDIITKIKDLTSYDKDTGATGIMLGDINVQSLQLDLESMVTNPVQGIPVDVPPPDHPELKKQTYNALSTIGITTGTNGLLSINDGDLSKALENNAADVGRLFGVSLDSDSPYVKFVASNSDTKASGGKGYDISITQAATRPTLTSGLAMNNVLAANETLTINNKQVTLEIGWSLSQVVDEINKHSTETNVSAYDTVVGTDHFLTLRSLQYGSKADITVLSNLNGAGGDTTGFGTQQFSVSSVLAVPSSNPGSHSATATAGLDVAGTINGERCKGNGQVLSADPESPTSRIKGLQVIATNSEPLNTNARFIKGVGASIKEMLGSMTGSTGLFSATSKYLNEEISAFTKDISDMELRISAQSEAMYAKFNAMESQLATLKGQGDTLSSQLASLNNSNNN